MSLQKSIAWMVAPFCPALENTAPMTVADTFSLHSRQCIFQSIDVHSSPSQSYSSVVHYAQQKLTQHVISIANHPLTYPSISTIRDTWLYSELPGNKGSPRNSSVAMQPKDHISIALV